MKDYKPIQYLIWAQHHHHCPSLRDSTEWIRWVLSLFVVGWVTGGHSLRGKWGLSTQTLSSQPHFVHEGPSPEEDSQTGGDWESSRLSPVVPVLFLMVSETLMTLSASGPSALWVLLHWGGEWGGWPGGQGHLPVCRMEPHFLSLQSDGVSLGKTLQPPHTMKTVSFLLMF